MWMWDKWGFRSKSQGLWVVLKNDDKEEAVEFNCDD